MAFPVTHIKSWSDFTSTAETFCAELPWESPFLFRGQSKAKWSLRPTLLREMQQTGCSSTDGKRLEKKALDAFKEHAHQMMDARYILPDGGSLAWLTLMQHHGVPTRLLDWTRSLYVALYFAVCDDWQCAGAVWALDRVKTTQAMEEEFHLELGKLDAKQIGCLFDDRDKDSIILCGTRGKPTQRMSAQQGSFTICTDITCDHAKALESTSGAEKLIGAWTKYVVPCAKKPEFLRHLRAMNITAATLFSGVDGLGRSVSEMVRLGAHKLGVRESGDKPEPNSDQ